MKYWGAIRIASLKSKSEASLEASARDCEAGIKRGGAKILTGGAVFALAYFIAPVMPVMVPLAMYLASPVISWLGIKEFRQNIDGRKAHADEAYRRTLLSTMPPELLPKAPAAAPSPKPVFNGEAAVVLAADMAPMKTIKIKAAPAAQ